MEQPDSHGMEFLLRTFVVFCSRKLNLVEVGKEAAVCRRTEKRFRFALQRRLKHAFHVLHPNSRAVCEGVAKNAAQKDKPQIHRLRKQKWRTTRRFACRVIKTETQTLFCAWLQLCYNLVPSLIIWNFVVVCRLVTSQTPIVYCPWLNDANIEVKSCEHPSVSLCT